MSSSITPKVEPGTPDASAVTAADTTTGSAGVTSVLEGQTLRVKVKKDSTKLLRKLVPFSASCPEERPCWRYFAHTYPDCRTRQAMTLQFKSKQQDDIVTNRVAQDAAREALCEELKEILRKKDKMPRISFDEVLSTTGQSYGLINLTFPSLAAFRTVHTKLDKIELDCEGSEERLYTCMAFANTLPGSVFILDCIDLPTQLEPDSVFEALASVTKELGSLLGLAKMVFLTNDSSFDGEYGTVRAYLALKGPWLTAPLAELVQQLPSHLLWHGIPHKLLYIGHDMHKAPKYSAAYPLSKAEVAAAETSGGRTSRETTRSEDDDTSSPSKKRKTAGQ